MKGGIAFLRFMPPYTALRRRSSGDNRSRFRDPLRARTVAEVGGG